MTTPANPLIATEGEPDPLDMLEGAGIYSSGADIVGAARPLVTNERFEPGELGAAGVGYGVEAKGAIDALGALQDPLGGLVLSPLIGWIIEHVEFVRELYDKLAGDPGQIKLHARTWHNVAGRLTEIADEHEQSLSGVDGWRGDAGDAYRGVAQRHNQTLRKAAEDAEHLAGQVMNNGALVGTVRALIRDLIADLVTQLIEWLAVALAGAVVTGGAALAPYVAGAVARAVEVASKIAKMVGELFRTLGASGTVLARLGHVLVEHGEDLTKDATIEFDKQLTKADREQANWDTRNPHEIDPWVAQRFDDWVPIAPPAGCVW